MSLVAHWKLDEASGLLAEDSVGEYDSTLVNFVGDEWSTDRRIGDRCLPFIAASQQYCIASSAPLSTGDLSISFWFKTTQAGGNAALVTRNLPSFKWLFYKNNQQKLWFDNVNGVSINSNVIVNDGKWYHVVLTKIGNATTLYINNSAKGSSDVSWTDEAGDIRFGHLIQWGLGSGHFDGKLDDIRYYNHGLSSEEISALYHEPMVRKLRTSGGDFTTIAGCLSFVKNSEDNVDLEWDIVFDCQGGASFGVKNSTNLLAVTSVVDLRGHRILFRTDPSEMETPSTLLGPWWINDQNDGSEGYLEFNSLKLGASAWVFGSMFYWRAGLGSFRLENCLVYTQGRPTGLFEFFNKTNTLGVMNNCTVFMGGTGNFVVGNDSGRIMILDNCVFFTNDSGQSVARFSDLAGHADSITFYNYSGGLGTIYGLVPTNLISTENPNLVDVVIQSPSDTLEDMMARSAYPTSSSFPILDNANPATAAATDILGHART